jgi:coenzyme F420-0:L-glutamate ligase/coenzyme F420-1:gamma-L-glutamate ligase
MAEKLTAFGVAGIGEVSPGDDLGTLLADAIAASGEQLRDGDVVVVSSKVVSKAEGRTMRATDRTDAVAAETVRVVAERVTPRGLTRIVEARSGPVLAAAGVDASNVAPGTVLLLPPEPDAAARALRARLRELTGATVGVVVSDTAGRAWRDGQTDIAIGAAGVAVVEDLRGSVDGHGQPLEVTVRALADELASLADLVKGKLTGRPVAVVRGLGELVTPADGPGAAALLRRPGEDWFRYGHVEAVRAALGVPPRPGGPADGVPPVAVPPDPVAERLRRAVDVALAAPDPLGGDAARAVKVSYGPESPDAAQVTLTFPGDPAATTAALAAGAFVQRLVATAWTEDLTLDAALDAGPPVTVRLTARA